MAAGRSSAPKLLPAKPIGGDVSKIADQTYLRDRQYKDASSLNDRIQLHVRFSTNPYGWMPWVFDQLRLPER